MSAAQQSRSDTNGSPKDSNIPSWWSLLQKGWYYVTSAATNQSSSGASFGQPQEGSTKAQNSQQQLVAQRSSSQISVITSTSASSVERPAVQKAFDAETGPCNKEPACNVPFFKRVSFARVQLVYEVPNMRQRLFKKQMRNRPDQWRRYGALKTIHVIGGWTCRDDNGSKVFERVEPGTPLPPEPKEPPIMTMEDFYGRRVIQRRKAGSSRRQHSKRRTEDDDERSVKSESDSDKDEV